MEGRDETQMEPDVKNNNIEEKREEEPRLCHVVKSPTFDGYGFNLHAEKSKPGQYIGKIDEGSPAEAAGLKQGDRIIEVNGASIANETHKQVVQRIKSLPNETKLLVVSASASSDPKHCALNGNGEAKQNGDSNDASETQLNGDGDVKQNNVKNDDEAKDISLKLNMTAAELRAQLASKKKYDPKKETIDFKKKFDIVQKL